MTFSKWKRNTSFASFRSIAVFIHTMFSLLVILFVIKLYAWNNTLNTLFTFLYGVRNMRQEIQMFLQYGELLIKSFIINLMFTFLYGTLFALIWIMIFLGFFKIWDKMRHYINLLLFLRQVKIAPLSSEYVN